MSVRLDVAKIIDRYEFDVVAAFFHRSAQDQPPDTPETVDANPNRHCYLLGTNSDASRGW